MLCKKCDKPGMVCLRKKDYYCEDCFITNINHKFRSCIGKNKILSSNDNVLVCLSGGIGSTVLLDLIHYAISMDTHKKLRVGVHFLHIIDTVDDAALKKAEKITALCKKYEFNPHIAHISEYMEESSKLNEISTSLPTTTSKEKFSQFLKKMPATVVNDMLPRIKHSLYVRYAKLLKCNYVFTAETTTTLASNLLSNLALGRGSQVQNDIGFCDTRDSLLTIIRPMREISIEELEHYVKIKSLEVVGLDNIKENSLQSVIKAFVTDLQDNFPATISTVCKTADKIGALETVDATAQCILCQSDVGTTAAGLTAYDATNFSRTISNSKTQDNSLLNTEENLNQSMFPHIHEHLCFSCSRNFSEMKHCLPDHLQRIIDS